MEPESGRKMQHTTVEFEIANNSDVILAEFGRLKQRDVRRMRIPGIVVPESMRLVLPKSVVCKLGLPIRPRKIKVMFANGRSGIRDMTDEARVQLLGRDGVFTAIVDPKRETALIGAIVLQDLDLLVESVSSKLIPRDPNFVISEIE